MEQSRLADLEHVAEPVAVEVVADHRRGCERGARVASETLDAPADDLAHALRQAKPCQLARQPPAASLPLHDQARLAQAPTHLAHEQRMPRRLTSHQTGVPAPGLVEYVPPDGP